MHKLIKFNTKKFNLAVGSILRAARRRTGLTLSQACDGLALSSVELLRVERGLDSLPCYMLYELFQRYEMTTEEVMFFCCPEETRKKFL